MTNVDHEAWSSDSVMPLARSDDLVMTKSGDELLVYDLRTHHIHHLNSVTAAVWSHCDGWTSHKHVSSAVLSKLGVPLDAEIINMAVAKLGDAGLLAGTTPPMKQPSRRDVLRRTAGVGLATIPTIVSISAPLAKASASTPCTMNPNTGEPIASSSCRSASKDWCCIRINGPWEDRDGVCKEIPVGEGRVDYECQPW